MGTFGIVEGEKKESLVHNARKGANPGPSLGTRKNRDLEEQIEIKEKQVCQNATTNF